MRLAIAATGIALVALLSGCATPQPEPDPTSAAPDPTPTVQPVTAPTTVLGLTCDGLLDLDHVRGWTAPDVALIQDESTPLDWAQEVAYAQQGDLYCVWGQHDDIAVQYISNQILVRVVRPIDEFRVEEPNCSAANPERVCQGTRDIGLLRLIVRWDQTDPADPSQAGGDATFTQILDTVAAKISGDPDPLWAAPDTSFTGDALCNQAAPWATALGQDPASVKPAEDLFGDPFVFGALGTGCTWTTPVGNAEAGTVPGGAWIWQDVRSPAGVDGWDPVSITGADDAAIRCGQKSCTVNLSLRGAFVSISMPASGAPDAAVRVGRLLAAI